MYVICPSVDSLRTFVQQYLDGELELYIKSEPVPEDNDGPVKVQGNTDWLIIFCDAVCWCSERAAMNCCKFQTELVFPSGPGGQEF